MYNYIFNIFGNHYITMEIIEELINMECLNTYFNNSCSEHEGRIPCLTTKISDIAKNMRVGTDGNIKIEFPSE